MLKADVSRNPFSENIRSPLTTDRRIKLTVLWTIDDYDAHYNIIAIVTGFGIYL